MAKKRTHRLTVRAELLGVFLPCVLVPLLIFGLFLFRSGSAELVEESAGTYDQMIRQLSIVLSEYISRVDQTTRMVDNTAAVPQYLRNSFTGFETDPATLYELEQNALSSLEQIARSNDDIYSLIASPLDGQALSYTDGKRDRPLFSVAEDYYAPLRSSTGNTVLLPVRTARYENAPEQVVFSVACKHLDVAQENEVGTGFYTGYVICECPVEKLSELCTRAPFTESAPVYIFDERGDPIYSADTDDARAAAVRASYLSGETGQKITAGGAEYYLTDSAVDDTGWHVAVAVPYTFLTKSSQDLILRFIWLCCLAAAIITVLTVIVSFIFTRPIRTLQGAMRRVGDGALDTRIDERRSDEFGDLFAGFNRLVQEVDQLIWAVSESEKRETVAKYQMLQSQIDPHFLYNSLDTIRMMAILDDEPAIADALLQLSALFRYHVRESDRPVRIREELAQVDKYLSLQKLRLQEKLSVAYDLDEGLLDLFMPKILLQPIVENCFSHGFADADPPYRITIAVQRQDGGVCLSVTDNGRGMTAQALGELRARLSCPGAVDTQTGHGIGLCNVSERLRLYFGDGGRLTVDAAPAAGTRIALLLPCLSSPETLERYHRPSDTERSDTDAER